LLLLLLKCDAIEVIFKEARRQLRAYIQESSHLANVFA
jgi:hypothetical protein